MLEKIIPHWVLFSQEERRWLLAEVAGAGVGLLVRAEIVVAVGVMIAWQCLH